MTATLKAAFKFNPHALLHSCPTLCTSIVIAQSLVQEHVILLWNTDGFVFKFRMSECRDSAKPQRMLLISEGFDNLSLKVLPALSGRGERSPSWQILHFIDISGTSPSHPNLPKTNQTLRAAFFQSNRDATCPPACRHFLKKKSSHSWPRIYKLMWAWPLSLSLPSVKAWRCCCVVVISVDREQRCCCLSPCLCICLGLFFMSLSLSL